MMPVKRRDSWLAKRHRNLVLGVVSGPGWNVPEEEERVESLASGNELDRMRSKEVREVLNVDFESDGFGWVSW